MKLFSSEDRLLRIFSIGMLLLFMLFLILALDRSLPQGEIFFRQTQDYMMDFFNPLRYSAQLDPYHSPINGLEERPYPAMAYLPSFGAYVLGVSLVPEAHSVFLCFGALFSAFWGGVLLWLLGAKLERGNTERLLFVAALFFSGTFLHAFERGNLILPTVFFCGVYLFFRGSSSAALREAALWSLALAASFKLAPALLGMLLIKERRWREAGKLLCYGAALLFLPFFLLPGGVMENLSLWRHGLELSGAKYLAFDTHTVFWNQAGALCRAVPGVSFGSATALIRWIALASGAALTVGAFFSRSSWKSVLALLLAMICVPSNSAPYNLLYLFPALVLFFNTDDRSGSGVVLTALFLLVFSPVQLPSGGYNWTPVLRGVALELCIVVLLCSFAKEFSVRRRSFPSPGES